MAIKVVFVGLEHCLGSSITGPMDMFAAANTILRLKDRSKPVFDCEIVSEDGNMVRTFNGADLLVDRCWHEVNKVDLIVIPGIFIEEPQLLTNALETSQPLLKWLREQADSNVQIAANCSGNFFLAEAGLLDGHPATTSWWATDAFRRRYPKVLLQPEAILTATDQFICSGSAMACMDMGIYLVERLAGRELAKQCARYMLIDVNRHNQAAYRLPKPQSSEDPQIIKAAQYIRRNINNEISVQSLAKELNMSTRTLIRKFVQETDHPPLAYIQKQRIEVSKSLLENSDLSLEEIVFEVGYQDSGSFRRLFKRETGMSPRDYRKRFTIKTLS